MPLPFPIMAILACVTVVAVAMCCMTFLNRVIDGDEAGPLETIGMAFIFAFLVIMI